MKKHLLLPLFFIFLSSPAGSAVFNVNTTGDCTTSPAGTMCLREAIILANSNAEDDQINLPAGHYILTIPGRNDDTGATGDLDILGTVSITGDRSTNTIIDANHLDRVFHVVSSLSSPTDTTATLTNLTIQNGQTDISDVGSSGDEAGGGLFNDNRTAILNNVIVRNNLVIGDANSSIGGGIFNRGTMEMYDCTVTGNDAERGGGIFNAGTSELTVRRSTTHANTARGGAGMTLYGTFDIKNSTVHNNISDPYSAGGVLVGQDAAGVFSFCTISNNRGGLYGGFYLDSGTSVTIAATILSNNRRISDESRINCSGNAFSSTLYNLEDANTCRFSTPINLIDTDPELGGLSRNGGFTPTLPLLSGSPAIDAVTAGSTLIVDQRGKPRTNGEYPDIGAYEYYSPICFPVRATNGNVTIVCI